MRFESISLATVNDAVIQSCAELIGVNCKVLSANTMWLLYKGDNDKTGIRVYKSGSSLQFHPYINDNPDTSSYYTKNIASDLNFIKVSDTDACVFGVSTVNDGHLVVMFIDECEDSKIMYSISNNNNLALIFTDDNVKILWQNTQYMFTGIAYGNMATQIAPVFIPENYAVAKNVKIFKIAPQIAPSTRPIEFTLNDVKFGTTTRNASNYTYPLFVYEMKE